MEINVSTLITSPDFVPFDLSNNRATLGDNAGALTWAASLECAKSGNPPPVLDTDEKREAFRKFVQDSGGWTEEEIRSWSDHVLYALFVQWVAGDIREAFGDAEPADWDWAEYEENCEAGRVSSRLFRTDDGSTYFYIGN